VDKKKLLKGVENVKTCQLKLQPIQRKSRRSMHEYKTQQVNNVKREA
jgi:hypothetical protein